MRRKVQSHQPQSMECAAMTEPSAEAFLPTMMTVQPSRLAALRPQVGHGWGSVCGPPLKMDAQMNRTATVNNDDNRNRFFIPSSFYK
jgi:hypothetical protein